MRVQEEKINVYPGKRMTIAEVYQFHVESVENKEIHPKFIDDSIPDYTPVHENTRNYEEEEENKMTDEIDEIDLAVPQPRKRKRKDLEDHSNAVNSRTRNQGRRHSGGSSDDSQSPFNESPFNALDRVRGDLNLPPRKKRRGTAKDHMDMGRSLKHQGQEKRDLKERYKLWCFSGIHFMKSAFQKETVELEKSEATKLYRETGHFFQQVAKECLKIKEMKFFGEICFLGLAACYMQCFRMRMLDMKNTGKDIHDLIKGQEKKNRMSKSRDNTVRMKNSDVRKTLFFIETSTMLTEAYTALSKAYPMSPMHDDLLGFKFQSVIDQMDKLVGKRK